MKTRTVRIVPVVLAPFVLVLALLGCERPPLVTDDVERITSALTSGAASVDCGGPALGSFVADTDFSVKAWIAAGVA